MAATTPSPGAQRVAITAWSAITFAALLAGFAAFRPVRDALVLDGSPDDIPWLFTATFVSTVIVSPLWSRLLANRPKRRVVPRAFHLVAFGALVFAALVQSHWRPVGVGRAFYVWSSVFNLFVVSVFWSLLVDLIGPGWAQRLYGPIAVGGTAGTLVGPVLARVVAEYFEVSAVLVLCAILLEVAVLGAWRVRVVGEALEREDGDAEAAADAPVASSAWVGFQRVIHSRYLLMIVGYVLCTATAATFLYLEQASITKAAFATREARTEFFAELDTWIAAATIAIQLVFAGPLLRWVGPGIVLCILPIAQAVGISTLALTPTVSVLAIVQVIARSSTHGLTRPARELLFTVATREDKYHAKNVIDLAGYRFGDFASSWAKRGLVALGGGAATLIAATLALTGIWLALAIALGLGFRNRTKEHHDDRSP
ncbi:MAG: MFS transporter [Kofleriaceae bacterium]|nr:MFS transporter [Kofleriaceae bacterium]